MQTASNNSESSNSSLATALYGAGSTSLYQDSLTGGGSIFENAEGDAALNQFNQFNIGSTQVSSGPTPPGYHTGSRKYDIPKQRVAAPRVVGNHWLNSPIYVLDSGSHETVRPNGPQNYGRGQALPGGFLSGGGSIDAADTTLNKRCAYFIMYILLLVNLFLSIFILNSSQIRSTNAQAILRQQIYQFSSANASTAILQQQAKAATPTLSMPVVNSNNSSVQLPNGSYVRSDSGRSKFF